MTGSITRRTAAVFASFAFAILVLYGARPAAATTELVMFEEAGCSWCLAWHEEIGPIYPKTEEAKAAPLRRVDIHDQRPEDLKGLKPVHYTPTFVLMHDGKEVARLLGYPGEDFFWGILAGMLQKLPGGATAPATN